MSLFIFNSGFCPVVSIVCANYGIYNAFGIFTKGDGSLSQDLTPEQAKVVTNSAKTILGALSTTRSVYDLKNKETDKAINVLNTILSGVSTASNTKNTVKDAKKKD